VSVADVRKMLKTPTRQRSIAQNTTPSHQTTVLTSELFRQTSLQIGKTLNRTIVLTSTMRYVRAMASTSNNNFN